jgi:hypothetical protein
MVLRIRANLYSEVGRVDTLASGSIQATAFVGDGSQLTGIVLPLSITSVRVSDASGTPLDDTAVDTATGGYVLVHGSGFKAASVVQIDGVSATSTTFLDSTSLLAHVQPKAAGTYDVSVVRQDGQSTTLGGGLTYSPSPSWSEASSTIGTIIDMPASYTIANVAGDSNVVVTTTTLPPGLSVTTDGQVVTISGRVDYRMGDTVFSFDATITDAENQDRTKTFSVWHASRYYSPLLGQGILNALQVSRDSTTALGTPSVSTVAGFPGSGAYYGGVLMADGRVFCVPLTPRRVDLRSRDEFGEHGRRIPGIGCIRRWGSHGRRPSLLRAVQRHEREDLRSRLEFGEHGRRIPGIGCILRRGSHADGRVFCVPTNATSRRSTIP